MKNAQTDRDADFDEMHSQATDGVLVYVEGVRGCRSQKMQASLRRRF